MKKNKKAKSAPAPEQKASTKDKTNKKLSKADIRAAKRLARKGDGSFPDILIVTKEESSPERIKAGRPKTWFFGHDEDLGSLIKNDEVAAVYKLRRVSTVAVTRKIAR